MLIDVSRLRPRARPPACTRRAAALVDGEQRAAVVDDRERTRRVVAPSSAPARERRAVRHRARLLVVDVDALEVAHRVGRRQHRRVGIGLDRRRAGAPRRA